MHLRVWGSHSTVAARRLVECAAGIAELLAQHIGPLCSIQNHGDDPRLMLKTSIHGETLESR